MALLCYNKGCGQRFDPEHNAEDSCLYHPGVPIFHDALKGWSCCKKRTTDFSEFLSIKGCTKGFHSKEKPPEPSSQEKTSDEPKDKPVKEIIVQGPKSAEKMLRERPSAGLLAGHSPRVSLQWCWTWQKGDVGHRAVPSARVDAWLYHVILCQRHTQSFPLLLSPQIYQGPESNAEVCTFHPGVPVFHEGIVCLQSPLFGWCLSPSCALMASSPRQDKKAVLCRQDWHQTGSQVVVTVYAKNPLPALSTVKANRTMLEAHVVFEGNKIFRAELELWGVRSYLPLFPSKVEITLCKASPGSWARLELPQSKLQPCGEQEKEAANTEEPGAVQDEDSDDSLSWSEEEDEELEMGTPDMTTPSH
uniref:Integrin subunit beta 1 binding protein 2 n=1 Tax=Malurus cyaneus samueli TaxID=2593467 RepID=A0A8C5U6X1_9PASS